MYRILLADDDSVMRLLLSRMLKRAGYDVTTAENGRQALEILQQSEISLLLTDWEMPQLDGVGLCRAVRQSQLPRYVYMIVLTARDEVDHIVTGLDAGADDYITKPFTEPELLARLNTGKRLLGLECSLREANETHRRLSITDALTGAYNRRYLMEHLQRELERCSRYSRPLSILLCDIDHFKLLNDQFGHQCGDEALVKFAQHLRSGLRECDWVARYGGEEFVVVLPETTVSGAAIVAERLRASLAGTPMQLSKREVTVTASFGVSGIDEAGEKSTVDVLFAAADSGVYASKAAGRNRITVLIAPAGNELARRA